MVLVICALGLILGWSYTEKPSETSQIPGFPEKITRQTETGGIPFVVVEQCFVNPVKKLFAQSGGRLTAGYGFFQGVETKKPVVAFFFIRRGNKVFICAYYYDDLIKSVQKKYPNGYNTKQAIKVLSPIIKNAAKKLLKRSLE